MSRFAGMSPAEWRADLAYSDCSGHCDHPDDSRTREDNGDHICSPSLSIDSIGRVDQTGEYRYDVSQSSGAFTTIEDMRHLDPPNLQPNTLPRPRYKESTLDRY